jgi:NAD(P)-dependent dehydrogenase (short-subunit alcohol dehydrogenase family)
LPYYVLEVQKQDGTFKMSKGKSKGTTLSCVIGVVGRTAAVVALLLAVAIAVVPRMIYTDLPADLTLILDKPTTMIITGANSGLGLASVMHFAHNAQATIIMACRSATRCANAKQEVYNTLGADIVKADLRPMTLDISSKDSIEAFANSLQGQPIHILMNNAGLAGATAELTYSEEDGVETHIHVNHLGHVRLAHCLWKNLQLAENSRIVVVTSLMATPRANYPTLYWYKHEGSFQSGWNIRQYGVSKRANLCWANELHKRFGNDPKNPSVVAAHPGLTHTELCKNGCKGKNKLGRYISNLELLNGIIKMTPLDGALSQAYAAVVPQAGIYIGPSLALVGEPKIVGGLDQSWHHMSFTHDECQSLWDKSMKALGIEVFGDYTFPVVEDQQELDVVATEEATEGVPETVSEA